MKNLLFSFLLFISLFGMPFFVMGHGNGHSHEDLSIDAAKLTAAKKLNELALTGKIDKSWVGIKPSKIEQKAPDFAMEWVVFFKNEKIKDTSKQTLYLFFSLDGDFIVFSYDGN